MSQGYRMPKLVSYYQIVFALDFKAGVSVTWNVLSWSGGHEFEPRSGRTWGAWYFCPKSYLDQTYLYWCPDSSSCLANAIQIGQPTWERWGTMKKYSRSLQSHWLQVKCNQLHFAALQCLSYEIFSFRYLLQGNQMAWISQISVFPNCSCMNWSRQFKPILLPDIAM